MKFAFDVHGVLDEHEEYRRLMRTLYYIGQTIYIISGQPLDDNMVALLKEHDLDNFYHEYRSIETYLLEEGVHEHEDTPKGKFWGDLIWNAVKAKMCEEEDIDMIFDNSPAYAETFKNVRTQYNLVIDKTRNLSDSKISNSKETKDWYHR